MIELNEEEFEKMFPYSKVFNRNFALKTNKTITDDKTQIIEEEIKKIKDIKNCQRLNNTVFIGEIDLNKNFEISFIETEIKKLNMDFEFYLEKH